MHVGILLTSGLSQPVSSMLWDLRPFILINIDFICEFLEQFLRRLEV